MVNTSVVVLGWTHCLTYYTVWYDVFMLCALSRIQCFCTGSCRCTSSLARVRRSPSTLCSSVCWHRCTPEPCCWPAWIRASLALRLRVEDLHLPLNTSWLDTGRQRSDSPEYAALWSLRCAYHGLWLLAPCDEKRQAGLTQLSCRLTELQWRSAWSPWAGCWWTGWDEDPPAAGRQEREEAEEEDRELRSLLMSGCNYRWISLLVIILFGPFYRF